MRVGPEGPMDRAYVAGGPYLWRYYRYPEWSTRPWLDFHALFLRGTRAVALGPRWSIALGQDGLRPLNTSPIPPEATNVTAIAAGATHALALRADGSLWAWDTFDLDGTLNPYGPLDVPSQAIPAMAIAAGAHHNLVVRSNGTVVAWGDNSKGQLQVPPTATNLLAVAAGLHHTVALRADGTVVVWGDNSRGQTNVPAEATNVVAVSAGPVHSVVLRADGRVVAWGASPEPGGVVGFFTGIDLLGYGCAADYMVFVDKQTP